MGRMLLLLVFMSLLAACGPAGGDVPPGDLRISGTVHAPAGGSVEGALVLVCVLAGEDCVEDTVKEVEITAAGASAAFSFSGLQQRPYTVFAARDVNRDGNLADGDYFGENPERFTPPASGVIVNMEVIGEGTNPPPPPPPPGVEPGILKGLVVDSTGAPMAGVEVIADNTLFYNTNVIGYTDATGHYRLDISHPLGTWQVSATATLQYRGQPFTIAIEPEDPALVTGAEGAVRDFALSLRNLSGPVLVMSGVGDYTPYEEIEMTLEPVGPIIDGSAGSTIVSTLGITGDGWAVTGVPYGRYRITATHLPTGETMLVSRPLTVHQDYDWRESYTADFSSIGLNIYQLRVEVRRSCDWPCE